MLEEQKATHFGKLLTYASLLDNYTALLANPIIARPVAGGQSRAKTCKQYYGKQMLTGK